MAMTTMFLPMFGAITPQDLEFGDHLDKSGNEMYFREKGARVCQVGSPREKL
jgi:hypothetical protein